MDAFLSRILAAHWSQTRGGGGCWGVGVGVGVGRGRGVGRGCLVHLHSRGISVPEPDYIFSGGYLIKEP